MPRLASSLIRIARAAELAPALLGAFALFAIRSRSVRKPAYYFLEWTLASPMVVWGLVMPPLAPEFRRPGLAPTAVHDPADR